MYQNVAKINDNNGIVLVFVELACLYACSEPIYIVSAVMQSAIANTQLEGSLLNIACMHTTDFNDSGLNITLVHKYAVSDILTLWLLWKASNNIE